jgi:hypothetical protein
MKFSSIAVFAAFLIVLFSYPAQAQMKCGARDSLVETLQAKYHEIQTVYGAVNANRPIAFELWANSKTGTWTIFTVDPQKKACIIGTGNSVGFETPGHHVESQDG